MIMKRTACVFLSILLGIVCLSTFAAAQQKDNPNCQDYPLFNRMPGYWIYNCVQKDFDSRTFSIGLGKKEQVEGRYFEIKYYPQANLKSRASELQILRNFENAIKTLGGKALIVGKHNETLLLTRDGKELWIEVWTEFTGKHGLIVVEKALMTQDIIANADIFANDLKSAGHSAVYGIYFDTGKSEIKPESEKAIAEIAKLLKNDDRLNVYVVGHTDTVGTIDSNLKLSVDRAEAVVQALIRDHNIAASRLKSFGNGPFAPVTTNDTEEGRAKNRRVELVKQ
jgi:OOP family OmpA-OmpF porin